MKILNLKEEKKSWEKGYHFVAGIDEAGRGALAGPVVAAAVMLSSEFKIQNSKLKNKIKKLKDSKKLTKKQREEFYKIITKDSMIKWGIGIVSEKIIDKINILEATKLAMEKAFKNLKNKLKPSHKSKISQYHVFDDRRKFNTEGVLILDGKIKLNLPLLQKSIIKADEKVFSCALASIIAKVVRDRIMQKYHYKYSQYCFNENKGYGTYFHLKALKKFGPCKIHRMSFYPLKDLK